MADIQDFFLTHARVSHKTLARFAEVDPHVVDDLAEDLGFGPLLRLDEAEEILAALADDDSDDDEPDDDEPDDDEPDDDEPDDDEPDDDEPDDDEPDEAAEEDEGDEEDDR